MFQGVKICFLADKHGLYDDRIYYKMAVPLQQLGAEVHYLLIAKEAAEGQTPEGIHYRQLRLKTFSSNRYLNFVLKRLNPNNNYRILFRHAAQLQADIYHFHDLWINRIGRRLKDLDHRPAVFYDAREPYAEDYVSYVKTPKGLEFVIRAFARWGDRWEKDRAKAYDLVISNEETVRDHFIAKLGPERAEVLFNYSDMHQFVANIPWENKKYDLVYAGGITELRGVWTMLEAVERARKRGHELKLLLLGPCYPASLEQELQQAILARGLAGNVEWKGAVPYGEIPFYYNQSRVGLVLLMPVRTYEVSMPIKLFEYMTFGLPVIGSDMGHIQKYLKADACGIAVDPTDSSAVADAVIDLLSDREKYDRYSRNGRKAAMEKYRWELEFHRLTGFYKKALHEREE